MVTHGAWSALTGQLARAGAGMGQGFLRCVAPGGSSRPADWGWSGHRTEQFYCYALGAGKSAQGPSVISLLTAGCPIGIGS